MQPDSLLQVLLQTVLLAVLYAIRKYLKDAVQVLPEAPQPPRTQGLGEARAHVEDDRPQAGRPPRDGPRGHH